jgi:hypothetical protein
MVVRLTPDPTQDRNPQPTLGCRVAATFDSLAVIADRSTTKISEGIRIVPCGPIAIPGGSLIAVRSAAPRWDHSVPGPKAHLITSRGRDLAFVPIGSYEIPLRA